MVQAQKRLLSFPNTSGINSSASCCACPQSAGLPTGRERWLYRCISTLNWLRVAGDQASESCGGGSAVGQGWGEQPSVPRGSWWVHCFCQATSVLWCPVGGWCLAWCWHSVSVPECLYSAKGGLQPWGACAASGVGLFLLKRAVGGFLFGSFLTSPTPPQTSETSTKKKKKKKQKEVEESSE